MERPSRKQIRLPGYDYSQAGVYFITICTHNRAHLLGEVVGAGLKPARVSGVLVDILESTWFDLQNHNPNIRADKFVVMPNHIHGIIFIDGFRSKALPEIVRQFKTFSARRINAYQKAPGRAVWQRGYYEHIIRNEQDYLDIWTYIDDNPAKWAEDEYS